MGLRVGDIVQYVGESVIDKGNIGVIVQEENSLFQVEMADKHIWCVPRELTFMIESKDKSNPGFIKERLETY